MRCGAEDEEEGGEGVGGKGLVAFRVVLGVFLPKLGGGCIGIGPLISVLLMCFLCFSYVSLDLRHGDARAACADHIGNIFIADCSS